MARIEDSSAGRPRARGPTLEKALKDPSIVPRSPIELLSPEDRQQVERVWEKMATSANTEVQGHDRADRDSFYGQLAIASALKRTHLEVPKEVAVLVGGAVHPRFQSWFADKDVYRVSDLPPSLGANQVIGDVCEARNLESPPSERLGPGGSVLNYEHHALVPTHATLDLDPEVDLVVVHRPDAGSSCVLGAAIAMVGLKNGLTEFEAEMFLRGMIADTLNFQYPGIHPHSVAFGKHLALLLRPERLDSVLLAAEEVTASPAWKHGLSLERQKIGDALFLGCSPLSVTACQHAPHHLGREVPDKAEINDWALNELDLEWARNPVCVLIIPNRDNNFRVCFRSQEPGPALRLAGKLGGGGHAYSAALSSFDGTYESVRAEVLRVLQEDVVNHARDAAL